MTGFKRFVSQIVNQRRTLWFLIELFLVLLILLIWLFSISLADFKSSYFLLFLFLVVIAFVFSSYVSFVGFFLIQNRLFSKRIPFTIGECEVEVYQHGYKTTPIMKSHEVKIDIPHYRVASKFVLTTDYCVLFFRVSWFLGLCKRDIPPIVVGLNSHTENYLGINCRRMVDYSITHYEDDKLVIPLLNQIKDVEKIKVIDFKDTVLEPKARESEQ